MDTSPLRAIGDIPDLEGKKVLVRADLNVPIKGGVVTNDFRIRKTMPTLDYLTSRGAKVILVSHLGRDPKETLRPVYEAMHAGSVSFSGELLGPTTERMVAELAEGSILLLENLRSDSREEANDEGFARELAGLADVYVNDAFSASHRSHASIVGVPQHLPGYAGFQLAEEVAQLSRALTPKTPSLCIIGGAKFETKEALVHTALMRYDELFIGGAIANDALRARGFNIGKSLVAKGDDVLKDVVNNPKALLPVDVTVKGPHGVEVKAPKDVGDEDNILDIGPESVTELGTYIRNAKTILWNGPLGNFENGFSQQTEAVAALVAESDAESYVGGGDTVAAIEKLGIAERFTFVSTGGGAMLDFLATGTLPGIDALRSST